MIGPLRVKYFPDLIFTPQTYRLFVKLSVLELEHSSTKSADRPNEFVNVYLCSIARVFILHRYLQFSRSLGALVAQQVNHWPADPAVQGLRPAGGGNLFNYKGGSIARTVKILKFGTPQTIAIIVLKIEKFDVTLH